MEITTKGVVIGVKNIDESDRVLTILSEDMGVITVYSNGSRKINSKIGAISNIFCYAEFDITRYKERYRVKSGSVLELFYRLREDIEKLALGSYLCQLSGFVVTDKERAKESVRLLCNSLYLLDKGKKDKELLKMFYEMRLMSINGFMPNFAGCRVCGEYRGKSVYVDRETLTEMCCDRCIARERATGKSYEEITQKLLYILRYIIYKEDRSLYSLEIDRASKEELRRYVDRYIEKHMGYRLSTLEYYKKISRLER